MVTDQELGGAITHTTKSGVAHKAFEDDVHALHEYVRMLLQKKVLYSSSELLSSLFNCSILCTAKVIFVRSIVQLLSHYQYINFM